MAKELGPLGQMASAAMIEAALQKEVSHFQDELYRRKKIGGDSEDQIAAWIRGYERLYPGIAALAAARP